jgi:hypothetical protein
MRMFRTLPLGALVLLAGCIHAFYETEAATLEPVAEPVAVASALRVHLADGGVALFRRGATVGPAAVEGVGVRYDLARTDSFTVQSIDMDSVVGIESFRREVDPTKNALVSTAATASMVVLTVAGLVAIACALDPKCFGSCPTVYSHTTGQELLEAELFSYSIAPLLEGRDVDVLAARADAGVVRLEVRNEAMETHYINHLQLLEVRHGPDERVGPDHDGLALAWREARRPGRAVDLAGRDVLGDVVDVDDRAFATTAARLAAVSGDDLDDHLDLTFPRPATDSAALLLDVRNSLLNTVLFYDMMLGGAGARALDWMADDLHRIGDAVQLGRWWSGRMGMQIAVWQDGAWQDVARLPDTGPIAWNHVAIPIAVPPGDGELRVRLRFAADAWRIDRVALATFRRPQLRTLPTARLTDAHGVARDSALQAVASPNDRYLETVAGDRFFIEFDVGPDPETGARTFLLSSQGYYTEWVRPAWIRGAGQGQAFVPSDEGLLEAMHRWRGTREEFEGKFYEARIPVR